MPSPDTRVLESWRPRFRQFEEDGGSSTLGQHNADGASTRTKITHVEFFGLGLVGSVSSVAYGSWSGLTAMLLVMQFDFRAKEGPLRFKRAEICISFKPQTKSQLSHRQPVVCNILPADNRTHGPPGPPLEPQRTSAGSVADFMWPSDEYSVKGRQWTRKESEVPNEITWTMYETKGSKFGICDSIRVAAIVACSEPFKATVDVHATTAVGIKVRNLPWSRDDPLLFDGATSRGKALPSLDLSTLEAQILVKYISEAKPLSLPAVVETVAPTDSSVLQSDVPTQKKSRSVVVYRVRGIPSSYSKATLVRVLSTALEGHEGLLRICTLAPDPYRPGHMAIVSFDSEPKGLERTKDKNEWTVRINQEEKQMAEDLAPTVTLLFDTAFLGFSSLGRGFIESQESHVEYATRFFIRLCYSPPSHVCSGSRLVLHFSVPHSF